MDPRKTQVRYGKEYSVNEYQQPHTEPGKKLKVSGYNFKVLSLIEGVLAAEKSQNSSSHNLNPLIGSASSIN